MKRMKKATKVMDARMKRLILGRHGVRQSKQKDTEGERGKKKEKKKSERIDPISESTVRPMSSCGWNFL